MLITKKVLKATDPSKLCLVITLEDGVKVQYPVVNTAEAIARYKEFLRRNAFTGRLDSLDFSAVPDTFSEAH